MDQSLSFALADDVPFANSPPETTNSDMWPLCLRAYVAHGVFNTVSSESRAMGITVDTPYTIEFAPNNDTFVFTFPTPHGYRSEYGHYTWSLAEQWTASSSGGQNTRQSVLTLRARSGDVSMMCLAVDTHTGSFTSSLGVATFDVVKPVL